MRNKEAMEKYLEDSARTVVDDVSIRRDVYKTDVHCLYDLNMFVEQGCNADLLKRSLFYGEEIGKTQARGYGYTLKNKKTYDALNIKELEEDKEEIKSKNLSLSKEKIHIIHSVLGLMSEAGEIVEEVISASLENRDLDLVNLKEEAGDLLWYMALFLRTINSDFEEAAEGNTAKLFARYPDKFNSENALNRNLEQERKVLEENVAEKQTA